MRRDFLAMVTVATASLGAAAFAWPFLDSLSGSGDGGDAEDTVDVDVSHLAPGQQMVAVWRGNPVFVVRRTTEALRALQDPALQGQLQDPDSAQRQQPDFARNWHRSAVAEYGVMVGICTHLGCVPRYRPVPEQLARPGGYLCPCHGSRFDLAGRVYAGSPAGYNLPVPPYTLIGTTLRIGIGPNGDPFDFADIVRL